MIIDDDAMKPRDDTLILASRSLARRGDAAELLPARGARTWSALTVSDLGAFPIMMPVAALSPHLVRRPVLDRLARRRRETRRAAADRPMPAAGR